MNAEISGQPIEIAIGPPLFHACPNVVKHPARIEITENEIAKFENPLQFRLSSWEYPSSARRSSSASTGGSLCLRDCDPLAQTDVVDPEPIWR